MEIKITARHLELTADMKSLTEKKVKKLRKFFPRVQHVDVLLEKVKYLYKAEILLKADHFTLEGRAEANDLQSCLDDALDKVERRLRKQKEKISEKKHVKKTPVL